MSFQISALPKALFAHLSAMPAEELARHGAVRQTVARKPGSPCRVSLADAEIGEQVLLVHFEHQSARTPFRASHAIYIRPEAEQAEPPPNFIPELFRSRMLSLRGFDRSGMMVQADLCDGLGLEGAIDTMLADAETAYLHLHYAKPGCYAARVDRV